MSATLITSGIDQAVAEPGANGGWCARFRSSNVGLHHQLYVNGRLADYADLPEERSFFLNSAAAPLAVRIAAVEAIHRAASLAEQLAPEEQNPSWTYRPRVPRSIANRPGEVLEVLGDHTTGELSATPLATAKIWPAWVPRWAFGEDPFGEGGFGYDGINAPGMGVGAFGAGLFGMDADLISVEAYLQEEGTHKLVLRTRGRDGLLADSPPEYVTVALPAAPASSLTAAAYDHQTTELTLQIS
jgi:hypothetical protein